MRVFTKALLFCALLVMFVGCGGGGGSTPSPFVGTWAGNWTSSDGDFGTGSYTVASNGALTGTTFSNDLGVNGTVTGNVSNGGSISGTVTYTGFVPGNFTGTVALGGGGTTLSASIVAGGITTTITNWPKQ